MRLDRGIARFEQLVLLAVASTTLCESALTQPRDPDSEIRAVQDYEQSLGLKPTGNFKEHTAEAMAAYRCYYTGKLELPASYEELKLADGSEKGCRLDTAKYDVFFYPIEAVASGEMAITGNLENADSERRLMVVLHEDLHQQTEDSKLPAAATEAASTLLGFITAAGFAADMEGGSQAAKRLSGEADLFLRKANIVNRYFAQAAELYRASASGRISKQDALLKKDALFRSLEGECRALGRPASFNGCPAALNNAGLAFDYTYTRYYPLLHELFTAHGRDVRSTVAAIQAIFAMKLNSGDEFAAAVRRASTGLLRFVE